MMHRTVTLSGTVCREWHSLFSSVCSVLGVQGPCSQFHIQPRLPGLTGFCSSATSPLASPCVGSAGLVCLTL